ncbi:unnamed protein product, partial [Prorocentrum cordatum]
TGVPRPRGAARGGGAESMAHPAAGKPGAVQATAIRIFPHDVGVSHDDLVQNVCWLARIFIITGVLLNAFEGILCLAGDVADAHMTGAKLLLSLGHLSVVALASQGPEGIKIEATGRKSSFRTRHPTARSCSQCGLQQVRAPSQGPFFFIVWRS